jgi:hypothetical protein
MKPEDAMPENSFAIKDSSALDDATKRKKMLDAKYEAVDISKIVTNCTHLSQEEQSGLHKVLTNDSSLFDGSLGTWKDEEYNIELKPDATPYHAHEFSIPKLHKATLTMEVKGYAI